MLANVDRRCNASWQVSPTSSSPATAGRNLLNLPSRGKTAWPKDTADQEKHGIRYDYDGEQEKDGVMCHKFQMQPNKGKIPSTIKKWRTDAEGGTHAVMADVWVPVEVSKEDVKKALNEAHKKVSGV